MDHIGLAIDEKDLTASESIDDILCQICNIDVKQYQCPRCHIFTCSLKCCKEHKVQNQCNGKRDCAEYVAKSNFKESNLRSDYHFLEDVLQTKDRAKRTLTQCGGIKGGNSNLNIIQEDDHKRIKFADNQNNIHNKDTKIGNSSNSSLSVLPMQRLDAYSKGTKKLVMAAKERKIQLMLMPLGMTKRILNKSRYNSKDNTIYWKLSIVFIVNERYTIESLLKMDLESAQKASGTQLNIVDDCLIGLSMDDVNENVLIDDLINQLLDDKVENSISRHSLRTIRAGRNKNILRCMMHKYPSPAANPIFIEVSMNSSLKDSLNGQVLVEYPTIYIGDNMSTHRLRSLISTPQLPLQSIVTDATQPLEQGTSQLIVNSSDKNHQFVLASLSQLSNVNKEEEEVTKLVNNNSLLTLLDYDSDSSDNDKSKNIITPTSILNQLSLGTTAAVDKTKEVYNGLDDVSNGIENIQTRSKFWKSSVSSMLETLKQVDKATTTTTTTAMNKERVDQNEDDHAFIDNDDNYEEEEEENEEFLLALNDFATKDIQALKAFIAAAEQQQQQQQMIQHQDHQLYDDPSENEN